jgi:hypothetical protein
MDHNQHITAHTLFAILQPTASCLKFVPILMVALQFLQAIIDQVDEWVYQINMTPVCLLAHAGVAVLI